MKKTRRDGTERTAHCRQLSLETLEPRILLDAGFGVQQVIENYSWDVNPQSVRAADLDGDGDQDVLAATLGPKNSESETLDKVVWFENLDDGGFGSEQIISTAVDRAETVRAADLDGDNDPDVLSASYADDKVAWYENQGDGTFGSQNEVGTWGVNEAGPLDTADMDQDGDVDILAASPASSWIGWFPNTDGQGSFGDKISVSGGTDMVKSVQAADLNGDDLPDVVASYGAGTADQLKLSWWANQGGGSFGGEQVIESGIFGMHGVRAVRVDGDTYPDVVLAAGDPTQKIVWYANQDGSGFGSQQLVSDKVGEPWSLYNADLDMDGDEDILCADYWHGISWFENTGGGFAAESVIESNAEWALSVHAADMDGDTDMDALGTWEKGDKVSFFRNTVIGPPHVASLSASPDPVVKPNNVTLTASGVDDSDGSVQRVEFYLDDGDGSFDAGNEIPLITDEDGADGWAVTGSTRAQEWTGGEHTVFARAQDDDGKWSTPASTQVTVQVRPTVDSVNQDPDPVPRPREVTITVEASDTDGTVQKVELYDDTNEDGSYDPGTDNPLASDTDGSDGWSWTASTSGWALGTHTFFAFAKDDDGLWSAPVTAELEVVENQPPAISSFSDSPDPVVRPNNLTLTAAASDPDGTLQGVEFYVDTNDNGTIEPADDRLLGSDSEGGDGWSWSGSTGGWPVGTHTYMARALDDTGFWSNTATTQGTVENGVPTITSFSGAPDPVDIGAELSLTAEASDPDGNVNAVGFYFDQNGDGAAQSGELMNVDSDGSDGWVHTVSTSGLSPGTYSFLARAVDNRGAASDLEATSVEADFALISTNTTNGSTVSVYDADASDGVAEPGIAYEYTRTTEAGVVILARPMGEKTVYSVFQTRPFGQTDDIGIVVEGNSQVRTMNWYSSIGFLLSEGQVNSARFGGGIRGARVGGLTTPGGWQVPDDVDNDGSAGDATGFYTPSLCKRLDSASPTAGTGIMGDIVAGRGLGLLHATNTHFGGEVRIGGTGAGLLTQSTRIVVRGGNIEGQISTDGDISSLVTTAGYDRQSGEYQGGHVKGDIHVSGRVGIVSARGGDLEGLLDVEGGIRSVKATILAGRGGGIPGGVDVEGSLGILSARGDVGSIEASDIGSIRVTDGRIDGNVEAQDGGIDAVTVRLLGESEPSPGEAWGIAGDLTASASIGSISITKRFDSASPLLAVDGGIEADSINRITVRGGNVAGGSIHAASDIGWITVIGGDLESGVVAKNGDIRLLRVHSQSVRSGDGMTTSVGGSIAGNVEADGRMGILSARGGEVGIVNAGEIGRITVTHGILSGNVKARSGDIGGISITKRHDSASPLPAVSGSVHAQGSIGRIVVRNGIVDLSAPGSSIHAGKGIDLLYTSGLLGDSDDNTKEILVDDGNLGTVAILGGNIRGVAADVNAGSQSDSAGNIDRLLVRGADRGILDCHFSADGNLQSLLVNRAWDVEAREWKGGKLFNTTVEAGSLHVIQVRGQLGEDDSDKDQDSIYAGEGSFWLQHQGWIQVEAGTAARTMNGLTVSAG